MYNYKHTEGKDAGDDEDDEKPVDFGLGGSPTVAKVMPGGDGGGDGGARKAFCSASDGQRPSVRRMRCSSVSHALWSRASGCGLPLTRISDPQRSN